VFAPERMEAVQAAAQAGASWRARLRIPEPSPALRHAISSMAGAARSAATSRNQPPDALLHATGDSQPDESALDMLVRAVLRSALDQRQSQQARPLCGQMPSVGSGSLS